MKRHLYTILLPVAAALALSGCTTGSEEADEHYIKLSDAVCTFTEDGGEAQIIEVRANPEWSFESGASWLKVSAGEGSTLEVSVDPNADGERNAEITLQAGEATASIRSYQLGARGLSARTMLEQLNSAVMSPSGRYVGGFIRMFSARTDFSTPQWSSISKRTSGMSSVPIRRRCSVFTEAEVVTDQGVLYISDSTNGGCVAFDLDGTYTVPKSIAGYGPLVMQSSSVDGSVMVGYTEGTPLRMYVRARQGGGRRGETAAAARGGQFPNEEWWAGILARGMSADGSVVYGTSWENYDYGMAYWDKDGNVDWVGSDLRTVTTVQRPNPLDGTLYDYNIVNGMICWANQTQIKPQRHRIAGTYRTEEYDKENDEVLQANYPAFFNTETKTTTVFDEYAGLCGHGCHRRRPRPYRYQGMGVNSGFIVDLASKTKVDDMLPWIRSEFGIIISEGAIHYLTPDRQKRIRCQTSV